MLPSGHSGDMVLQTKTVDVIYESSNKGTQMSL